MGWSCGSTRRMNCICVVCAALSKSHKPTAAGLRKIREVNHSQLLRPAISPRVAPRDNVT
jgi:hypothetical protein